MTQILQYISENALTIIGIVVAAITAIGVFYGPKLVAKSQERKEKLRKHFNDLQDGAIKPLISIIAGLGISTQGDIFTNFSGSFSELDNEQLECFQAHYTKLGDKWQELTGKWTKQQGRVGGRWDEQNEKVDTLENQIRESIEKKCKESNISLPIRPFVANQELINDGLLRTLCGTICNKSQGISTDCDFNEAKIEEENNFYIVEVCATKWARARTADTAEKLKSIFTLIQNSPEFRQQASLMIENAKQIKNEFDELLADLDKIQSRGFVSKDPKYKFQAVKKCAICKELFY